jgi:hypothetical protein
MVSKPIRVNLQNGNQYDDLMAEVIEQAYELSKYKISASHGGRKRPGGQFWWKSVSG